ncbi:MscS Mechanosensitive ion channel [Paraburkholderia atlantica]|uniref:Small-conductance mechanosensitive channel n=1 Tax=Paraburkholderia atlantica TaxID=2654982 RepID=D5W5F4_PARAM|nr:MscS Mechanosensitive ion channel [Paraburkholderia atlantica]
MPSRSTCGLQVAYRILRRMDRNASCLLCSVSIKRIKPTMNDSLYRFFHLQPSLLVTLTHDVVHIAIAVLILVVGWWLSNRVGAMFAKALERTHADPTLPPMLAAMGTWAVRVLAFIAALGEVGIATASVLAVLGAAGLAIGLALQGTLQNIAAGMMLLLLRPFRVGDVIEGSGAAAGIVHEVELFTTRIERGDGNIVFVPNSQIWSNPVINYSCCGTQRIEVDVELAQRKDVDAAIGHYNEKHPHSALKYHSPREFRRSMIQQP